MFKLNGFKQLIKSPTRTNKSSATSIDLIFTTNEQYISKSLVYGYGISDHDLTGIIRNMNIGSMSHETINISVVKVILKIIYTLKTIICRRDHMKCKVKQTQNESDWAEYRRLRNKVY